MTKCQYLCLVMLFPTLTLVFACSTENGGNSNDSSDDGGVGTTDGDTSTQDTTDEEPGTDDSENGTEPPDSDIDSAVDSETDSGADTESDTEQDTDTEPEGMITFNTSFGGDEYDIAYSVLQTPDGGYLVTGYSFSFVNDQVDVSDKDFIITNNDVLLGKFSKRGELEWKKSYGDRFPQNATSMIVAPDGGYLLAGGSTASFGKVVLDIEGEDIEFDKIRENALLLKVEDDGTEEWSLSYGETYTIDQFFKVMVTEDNHYLAVGRQIRYDEDYADDVMAPSYHTGNAQMMHYAVKTDLEGTVVWEKAFNTAGSTWDQLKDVVESPSGYMVVGGSVETIGEGRDFYVAELAKDTGAVSWEKTHPARKRFTGDDYAEAIHPIRDEVGDITGYLLAGGQDRGYDTFDRDLWGTVRLLKIDLSGNKVDEWTHDITGGDNPEGEYVKEGIDEALDLVQTADGKFVVLSAVAYDVFVKFYEECDLHLMKIDQNGQVDWERRYGTLKKYDRPAEILVTADDGFIIVGATQSFLEPGAKAADDFHLIKTDPQGEIE